MKIFMALIAVIFGSGVAQADNSLLTSLNNIETLVIKTPHYEACLKNQKDCKVYVREIDEALSSIHKELAVVYIGLVDLGKGNSNAAKALANKETSVSELQEEMSHQMRQLGADLMGDGFHDFPAAGIRANSAMVKFKKSYDELNLVQYVL